MKKIFYLLSITFLMLQSCSSDDSSNDNTPNTPETYVLPKTVKININNTIETYNITYSGNKIQQISSGTFKQIFTYTGDLITKIEGFVNDIKQSKQEFNYVNQMLDNSLYYEYYNGVLHSKYKATYTFLNANLVNVANYEVNINTGVEEYVNTEKRDLLSGNIIRLEGGWENSVRVYEFDENPAPFSKVLGFDKLIASDLSLSDYDYISVNANNIITENSTGVGNNYTLITSFSYNANNYPIKATVNSLNSSAEYFY